MNTYLKKKEKSDSVFVLIIMLGIRWKKKERLRWTQSLSRFHYYADHQTLPTDTYFHQFKYSFYQFLNKINCYTSFGMLKLKVVTHFHKFLLEILTLCRINMHESYLFGFGGKKREDFQVRVKFCHCGWKEKGASCLNLTPSLPWCHLKTTIKSVKFETLKPSSFLFHTGMWKDFHQNA